MWVRVIAEPEFRDGVVVALNGVIQDVSGLRAAERMVEETDRYAMGLMDVLEARVGVVNAEGEIIRANRVWRERLQALDITVGHGGHGPSFGPQRRDVLVREYLAGRRAQGCPRVGNE